MMWFSRSDSLLTISPVLFVFFQRHQPRQLFYRAGHGRQRLADLVGDGGGKPSQRRHALFCGHFLFQSPQIGQVLEIKYVAASLCLSRAQWRNADADIALLPLRRTEVDLLAQ